MEASDVALWLSGAGTTVIGSMLAWLGQSRMASRQRQWSIEDVERSHAHEASLREKDIREDRLQRLRAERRETYGRLLDSVEDFVEALRDLRDSERPAGVEVSAVAEVETADPIAARALGCLARQRRMDSDIVLIADPGVRDNVLRLSQLLRDAFREATAGRDALPPVTAHLKVVLREMRKELVGT
ncbi:hypothetical protein [Nocardioides sp. SLBN-35]|uniref:hypothetical protein n=1 Tax=Nocardioides sp. SLBN-35 TaxID=2768445 RepID=UPI00114D6928|nr:hypothetical protein [Nocardioides sp. SLBN-35]